MPIGGMTPQMMALQPQLMSHTANMQQMEPTEIENLFKSICSQLDPELLQATFQKAGLGQGLPGMPLGGAPNMPRPQGQNRNQNHDQNNRGGSGRGSRGGHYGENSRGGKKPYVQYQGGPQQNNYQQSYGANRNNNNDNQRSQYSRQQPPVPIGGLDTDNFPAFGTQPPTAGQNKKKY